MGPDPVLDDFARTGNALPRASMQWALDNWGEVAPRFLSVLDHYVAGDDVSERSENQLFFILHLLGQKAEQRAFASVCRLIRDNAALERILGDGVTESLPQILIGVYDGDRRALRALIEAPDVDEYVRYAALEAWTYFTATGAIDIEETKTYLRELAQSMQPQEEHVAWVGIIDAAAHLGLQELRPVVEGLKGRGLVSDQTYRMADFDSIVAQSLAAPDRPSALTEARVGPFDNVIDQLSQWYYFSDRYTEEQTRQAELEETEEALAELEGPYVNPFRHIGRNDLCPCGSGKKFKKCCMI